MVERNRNAVRYAACVAYYRGTLPCAQRARVRAYLGVHADVARHARLDAAHESAVAQHWAGVLAEPLPPRLQVSTSPVVHVWPRRVAMAATIVLSVAGGCWLGDSAMPRDPATAFATRVTAAAQQPAANIAVAAGQGMSAVPAPDLSARGYRLVRQQRVGTNGQALIEFVYRNRGGQRVRIYAETDDTRRMAPTITSQDGMSLALWRENGTRYALVGDVPALSLQTLAQAARIHNEQRETQLVGAGPWRAPHYDRGNGDRVVQQQPTIKGDVMPATSHDAFTVRPSRM